MLTTGLGALPFVFVRRFPDNLARLGWAFAGGIMLSASVFNLIIPGVNQGGIPPVALGVLVGTALIGLASMYLTRHEHDERGISIPTPGVQGGTRVAKLWARCFCTASPRDWRLGLPMDPAQRHSVCWLRSPSPYTTFRTNDAERLTSALATMVGFLFLMGLTSILLLPGS